MEDDYFHDHLRHDPLSTHETLFQLTIQFTRRDNFHNHSNDFLRFRNASESQHRVLLIWTHREKPKKSKRK